MSDKVTYQSKFFRVLELEVERKGKKFTKDLIERNGAVFILPLTNDNELYMEWQYRDAFQKEILEVVAGTVENNVDPLETAKRELKEETGLTANNWRLLAATELGVNMRAKGYFYLATDLTQGEAKLDDDEELTVIKMPFSKVVEKVMNGEIIAAPHIAAILMLDNLKKEGEAMKIFTVGGSGLVGSRIVELLEGKHEFTDLSLTSGVDITDPTSLDVIRNDTEHEVVLLLAAKADVDGCEEDKPLGEEGAAYKINVGGTKNVAEACKASGKKLLYISTDFVFDGEKEPPAYYTEEDTPNPINWYAMTKYKGEEVVKNSGAAYCIVRIAYPYRKEFDPKKDFVRAIASRLENKQPVMAVTDHIMTPLLIDDLAYAIDALIEEKAEGIYHVVGDQSMSPYEAALIIADTFGFDKSLISKTTRAEYFKGKANRPFNLSLNNAKIKKLNVTMHSFAEGLQKIIKV